MFPLRSSLTWIYLQTFRWGLAGSRLGSRSPRSRFTFRFTLSGDTLAVIRLDRRGRSLRELLETVEDLKGKEINLNSLEERIDITSAAGELVFHVFGAIAQFERRLISKRTKDGMATARKHGRNPGRPPLQLETISALQDLVEAGKSVSQAAKHLGIGRSTAYKVINEASQR